MLYRNIQNRGRIPLSIKAGINGIAHKSVSQHHGNLLV